MNPDQETAQTWNKLAARYEELFMPLALYNESYDWLLAHLPKSDASVLEVGCGPGNISFYLLRQRPQLSLYGIDYAPAMIELAQKNNPTATFEVMDCRQVAQLHQKFDAVVCGFCLPYLSPAEGLQFVKDCAQLLNPGGLLYLSFVPGDPNQSGWLTGSSGHRAYFYYYTVDEIVEWLSTCGFALLNQQTVEYRRSETVAEEHCILFSRKGEA